MAVNTKGRECVEALFPYAHIAWRDAGPSFPADWLGFKIHVPDVRQPMSDFGGIHEYEFKRLHLRVGKTATWPIGGHVGQHPFKLG